MSKFNQVVKPVVEQVLSANGNLQDVKSNEQQFYEIVVNTLFGKDSFYETSDERATRLANLTTALVDQGKVDFVANMLLYARTEMNIRNMPLYGVSELAYALRQNNTNYANMRKLVGDVIGRVDQITDLLSLLIKRNGSKAKLPAAVKRGLSDAFNKFDEYQFSKYNRKGAVTLQDALRIVHPTPKDGNGELFAKIMSDNLKVADTWETALSTNGQKSEGEKQSKSELWEDLILREKLGYQAALKNLRNILEAKVSMDAQRKLADMLVARVHKSKALPFEFLAAYNAIDLYNNQIFKQALRTCMDKAVDNVPKLGNRVWVIRDTSGSMQLGGADKTAAFFASVIAAAHKNCEYFALTDFDSSAKQVSLNLEAVVYANYSKLMEVKRGGSTNFEAALLQYKTLGFVPDTVFVLTDNEINRFGAGDYWNRETGAEVLIKKLAGVATCYVINAEASESTPLPPRFGWHALAGLTPKFFDYAEALKNGSSIVKLMSVPYPYTNKG